VGQAWNRTRFRRLRPHRTAPRPASTSAAPPPAMTSSLGARHRQGPAGRRARRGVGSGRQAGALRRARYGARAGGHRVARRGRGARALVLALRPRVAGRGVRSGNVVRAGQGRHQEQHGEGQREEGQELGGPLIIVLPDSGRPDGCRAAVVDGAVHVLGHLAGVCVADAGEDQEPAEHHECGKRQNLREHHGVEYGPGIQACQSTVDGHSSCFESPGRVTRQYRCRNSRAETGDP
jgi:hypothetical protein